MLKLNWVNAGEKKGFSELIIALSQAPYESLYGTNLVKTLIEHFWSFYFKQVLWRSFLPFTIYFVTTVSYLSIYAVPGIDADQRWAMTPEFFMRWIILAGVGYFAFFEVVAIIRNGKNYLKDIFYNLFDWTSFSLNVYLLWVTVFGNKSAEDVAASETNEDPRSTIRGLAVLAVLLMWVKLF